MNVVNRKWTQTSNKSPGGQDFNCERAESSLKFPLRDFLAILNISSRRFFIGNQLDIRYLYILTKTKESLMKA